MSIIFPAAGQHLPALSAGRPVYQAERLHKTRHQKTVTKSLFKFCPQNK
jgi:hypothetical protein